MRKRIKVVVYEELKKGDVVVLAEKSRASKYAYAFVNIVWVEGVPYKVTIV